MPEIAINIGTNKEVQYQKSHWQGITPKIPLKRVIFSTNLGKNQRYFSMIGASFNSNFFTFVGNSRNLLSKSSRISIKIAIPSSCQDGIQ